jgi:hypothetical protein
MPRWFKYWGSPFDEPTAVVAILFRREMEVMRRVSPRSYGWIPVVKKG